MIERRSSADDRRLLGEMLLEAGIVTRRGLAAGIEEQRLRGGRLGYLLLRLGQVTPAALYLFLQEHFTALSPDLLEVLRSGPAVDLMPARLARFYNMVPIRVEDGALALAVATADSPRLIPAIEELTGFKVDPIVCPPSLIAEALERFYPYEVEPGVLCRASGDNLFILSDRRRGIRPLRPEVVRSEAPAADWLRALGAEAIHRGARTLIVEPQRGAVRVLFRGARGEESGLAL
ncbi:MAG TPA: hypothetical protein VFT43_14900, partial [Candidatus Polarisedimenticolia bacterium]|nr:hypothetical protein [Candidatus Polarisedimenticolia bacterium]